jgi:hypothetical protein
MLWQNFESVIENVALTTSGFTELYRSVFIQSNGDTFNAFQECFIAEKCNADFIDAVFLSEGIKKHCKLHFAQISCSKIHKKLHHFDRALELAKESYKSLQHDSRHSNLATNLAEVLGTYALVEKCQEKYVELRSRFYDIASISQIEKYERQYFGAVEHIERG